MNEIRIQGLEITAHIGVPEEERQVPQRLVANVILVSQTPFDELQDDIDRTANYDAVARRLAALAAERPRQLIETLACEMVDALLAEYPIRSAEIEIRKFILPQTEYVAVRHRRSLPPSDR